MLSCGEKFCTCCKLATVLVNILVPSGYLLDLSFQFLHVRLGYFCRQRNRDSMSPRSNFISNYNDYSNFIVLHLREIARHCRRHSRSRLPSSRAPSWQGFEFLAVQSQKQCSHHPNMILEKQTLRQ